MPIFTGEYPRKTGDTKKDTEALLDWAVGLIDELKFVLSNLDECNISENYKDYLKEV